MLSSFLHRNLYYVQLVVENRAHFIFPFLHLVIYGYYGGFTIRSFLVITLVAIIGELSFKYFKKDTDGLVITTTWKSVVRAVVKQSGIYVLIWKNDLKGTTGNVGHVALHLSDKTYISKWPAEELLKGSITKKRIIRGQYFTIEDDFVNEGKCPDLLIKIPDDLIDSTKVREWYNQLCTTIDTKYNLKIKSCSDMVEDALKTGDFFVFSEIRRYRMLGFNVPFDFAERLLITLTFRRGNLFVKLFYTLKSFCVWVLFSLFAICFLISIIELFYYLWFLKNWILQALKSD